MYTYIKIVNKYYQKKKRLQKESCQRYQNLSEEEKEKKKFMKKLFKWSI